MSLAAPKRRPPNAPERPQPPGVESAMSLAAAVFINFCVVAVFAAGFSGRPDVVAAGIGLENAGWARGCVAGGITLSYRLGASPGPMSLLSFFELQRGVSHGTCGRGTSVDFGLHQVSLAGGIRCVIALLSY